MPIPPLSFGTALTRTGSTAATAGTWRAAFGAALRSRAPPAASVPPAEQVARAALQQVERARHRLDQALAAARRGQTFTAQELLVLQADAYRFSQTVEVASKIVEQGAQAVKQAVNTQV